jgi:voltage-gated potassium channel
MRQGPAGHQPRPGVRIYRDGIPHGFWEPEARSLIPATGIVEILPNKKAERDLD